MRGGFRESPTESAQVRQTGAFLATVLATASVLGNVNLTACGATSQDDLRGAAPRFGQLARALPSKSIKEVMLAAPDTIFFVHAA
jgi:hypothetical protein